MNTMISATAPQGVLASGMFTEAGGAIIAQVGERRFARITATTTGTTREVKRDVKLGMTYRYSYEELWHPELPRDIQNKQQT